MLGRLSTIYIPPQQFSRHADCRLCRPSGPDFRCDPREVAELIEVPLSTLFDRDAVKREPWTLRGVTVEVPFYQIGAAQSMGRDGDDLKRVQLAARRNG